MPYKSERGVLMYIKRENPADVERIIAAIRVRRYKDTSSRDPFSKNGKTSGGEEAINYKFH